MFKTSADAEESLIDDRIFPNAKIAEDFSFKRFYLNIK